MYSVLLDLDVAEGARASETIAIGDRTFVLEQIKWAIVADGTDNPAQDGLFRLTYKIHDRTYYHSGVEPLALHYGSPAHGRWADIPPVRYVPHARIAIEVVNAKLRANPVKIQICLWGCEEV
jgi:hypothetical protein